MKYLYLSRKYLVFSVYLTPYWSATEPVAASCSAISTKQIMKHSNQLQLKL